MMMLLIIDGYNEKTNTAYWQISVCGIVCIETYDHTILMECVNEYMCRNWHHHLIKYGEHLKKMNEAWCYIMGKDKQ